MDSAEFDSGLQCLIILATYHGVSADAHILSSKFGVGGFGVDSILLAARSIGMKAKLVKQNVARLQRAPLPCIALDTTDNFFIVAKVESDDGLGRILIQRPGKPAEVLLISDFEAMWAGKMIYLTNGNISLDWNAKFDFTWFIPSIVKYRKILGEILLVSFVLQIIGLVTPMFFQVVMDKVLVNNAINTLNVISIGFIAAILFESILTAIRTAAFSNVSSKIDVELGAKLFKHLLSLPIGYFEMRRAGDSVARVRELEGIRSFLTSNAMSVLLDIMFSFVFIGVMYWYSPPLTFIVLISIPIYFILSFVFTPILRAKLNDKFNKGAENQSFLVETLSGINTLKSMSVEYRWQQKWDKQLAAYVAAGLTTTNVGLIASGSVNIVSKLVTAAIMWLGAMLVIDNKISVGQLVAFNMLSSQVSSPILRLAQLWNDFQQVGISMKRLGDVLEAHPEVVGARTRIPTLSGAIKFSNVSFRYRPGGQDVISNVSFTINPGEIIGIVGRSGSGKSTLTKLVQRLYICGEGRITIDGQDVAAVDIASLRRQIGVVLQESTLFSRSIRDNIALIDPSLPIEKIIDAAKLAGAHDFICELPEGYDTLVGENGTGLSGGQKQRIAIARALIVDPAILIFDEATSALDYESEQIIQKNMREICVGRTVLIIAHRLSAVREANRIIVMERGLVHEEGKHEELLENSKGIYYHLFHLQNMQTKPADVNSKSVL